MVVGFRRPSCALFYPSVLGLVLVVSRVGCSSRLHTESLPVDLHLKPSCDAVSPVISFVRSLLYLFVLAGFWKKLMSFAHRLDGLPYFLHLVAFGNHFCLLAEQRDHLCFQQVVFLKGCALQKVNTCHSSSSKSSRKLLSASWLLSSCSLGLVVWPRSEHEIACNNTILHATGTYCDAHHTGPVVWAWKKQWILHVPTTKDATTRNCNATRTCGTKRGRRGQPPRHGRSSGRVLRG